MRLGILLMVAAALGAQSPAPPLAFEVATVKPAVSGYNGIRGGCHGIDSTFAPGSEIAPPPLGRCVLTDARLGHLVNIAFSVRNMGLIKGGPDWVTGGDERFNVEGKAEDPAKATEQQLLTMLQNLLIDRFQLKFHRETVEMTGYALTVGKNAPKLKPSTSDKEMINSRRSPRARQLR